MNPPKEGYEVRRRLEMPLPDQGESSMGVPSPAKRGGLLL
jgi:hypothetical protein